MPPSDDKEKVENEENEKNDMSDTKSNQSDKSDKSDKSKETPKKGKGKKDMADKMDPTRFQDGGVNFKAKLIGLENVPDARGDKMCQDAMMKLKGMVKTAKAHKPKITVNVSLEGLKIIDEISQNVMHHHAVHKISFISRDIKDARAFGYIYGLGEGKHQFFGIKTDKPAETLVLTLRDLFQVVFEMKKQEVEAAKARKTAKDDEKAGDKPTESETEKPAAQEGAYDVPRHLYHRNRHRQRFRHDTYPASGGSEAPKEVGEKTIPQSNSSANLLDLENQLLNLEVTFEQVDAFSAAAPVAASAAAATSQFPVSFEQNFGNQAMGAQRDPFNTQTPTLAPPPNYGTQQQQQKQPMQQQQPFPPAQPGDPFNTDAFGQTQFGAAPVQGQPQVQQMPTVQQQQPMQQPSFAAFPPQQAQMQSPQHAMPPQQQQQQPQFAQQFPAQQPPQVQQQQQPQQQQVPPQGAFGSMPVQKDPFKDDPFFTQAQCNDRYAAFSSLAPTQPPAGAPIQAMMGAPLQPMQPGGQAPSSPNMSATHESPAKAQDSFGDLGTLADFKPANQYVDRTQFFKPPEQPKPSLNAMVAPQPQQQQVGSSQQELVRGDSTRSSRNRPRPAQSTTDPFGSDPMTDPFGSAPFSQPTASFESQEPDPFDTSAILAKTHFQGPFDTSQLRPSAAVGLSSKPQAPDISASSSTPPTTRSDKIGRDTTSSNVSTPEDFSMPSPEVPPPPLPQQGMVEMPEQAPAPPPRPSFTSSSRPGMTRQSTIDVGAMSRRGGRMELSAFTRQATIDFTEESSGSPPALPPRPPSSGPLSQPLSLPETPPPQYAPPPLPPQSTPPPSSQPPHFTPPSLPKHDTFQSRTLPRQKTVPSQPAAQASHTISRQSTMPAQDMSKTPPVSSKERQWHMPGVLPQQDQFSFPPFEPSTPPPFQAFKHDPFAPQSTPPGSPRLGQRGVPATRQLSRGTPPLGVRQDNFNTPPTSVRHDSLGHPSPNASPTPNISPSPSGTSVVARPRPRPRPRTPGGAQPSPTLTHVPENAKSSPVAHSTPPSSRSTPPLAQSTPPDPFSRDGHMRHSERFPTESFSRDAHQRQSDRTDVQAAARRVDSVKALLRTNQSEPMFSVLATETITLAPAESLKEEPLDLPGLDESRDDPFPEGVDPFVDDSPIDPFSENDPFNKDITQQVVAFRTKAIGSKDSESVKGSLSDSFVEDPFANDPFFTSGGKGTPVVSSPALSRQGRKQSRDSVRSEASRSRTISERSTSESQHDSDPFSTVPIKRNDSASKARSDTSSVHSSTTPDPFMVDWGSGASNNKQGITDASIAAAFPTPDTTQQSNDLHQSSNLKDQSNVSSSSDLGEVIPQSKPTNGSAADVFDNTVNGVSDSDSTRTDSASLHSDPFASLDPFKFVLGSKKPDQQSSWPTFPSSSSSSVSQFRSDSPRTQSPFRDPFVVDPGLKVNGSSQLDFGGESRGGREGSVGSGSSNDNPFSSSSSQPQNGTVPQVPARQFQGNPFATQNQWTQ